MTHYTNEEIAQKLDGITDGGKWTCSEYHPWVNWGDRDPGPIWEVDGPDYSMVVNCPDGSYDNQADAEFIAAAPDIVRQQCKRLQLADLLIRHMEHVLTDDQFMNELGSDEFTDAYLRYHGYDPEELVANVRATIEGIIAKRESENDHEYL